MKRLLNKAIILAMLAVTWMGCSQDDAIVDYNPTSAQESESNIQISLNLNIPDPIQASSRNGITEKIENITVLCFDKDGLALKNGKQVPTLTPTGNESGSLKVTIPNATRILHLFANQTEIPFVIGMSEDHEDLVELTATDNKMVYWGRIEVPSDVTSSADAKAWWADAKTVVLLRNMAKVEVKNNNLTEFALLGYTVIHTNKKGFVIPVNKVEGNNQLPTANVSSDEGFSLDEWIETDYVNSPTDEGVIMSEEALMQTDIVSDNGSETGIPFYVFETQASSDVPASIIIYGYNTAEPENKKYWRVEFADAEGKLYNVRRNHRYTVNIEGNILGGYTTLDDAVNNDPIGIMPEIADEVTAVKNSKFSMTVENTSYVLKDGTESLKFNFEIEQLGDEAFNAGNLSVTWENGQNVSGDNEVSYTSTTTGKLFEATVTVSIKPLAAGAERQEGTIVINYDNRLKRKVNIAVIPLQQFTVVDYNGIAVRTLEEGKLKFDLAEWDYTDDSYFMVFDENKPAVPIDRLKFSIPAEFPEALYPFNVLISCNDLNALDCPLIFSGDNRYGEDNGIGFKYVYNISSKEDVYEVILRSIDRNLITDQVDITLESEYFESVKLNVIYPDFSN